ncbi:ANK-REP-REGION domain-containing protein [Mycena venus]|uniref:ANK-REP-REGION domain-containing protein n=1 Tax=Mycena venus TaxID=2733690 RepID=A0A8H6XNU7_9AGAR|nr:ANK-REP-REGION domain-containing protein [Mycena venus]
MMASQVSDSRTVNQYIYGGKGGKGGNGGAGGGSGGRGDGPKLTYQANQIIVNHHHGSGPDQQQRMDFEERTRIIDWLSPINFFIRHADISRVRQKDTGGWLLADPRFKRWESGSERTLWCRGIPGGGKTILVSKVVDHLTTESESKNTGVACIYLNHKEADIQTPARLLSGLWRQLVLGQEVGPLAMQLYQQYHEKGTTPSLDDICNILNSSLIHYPKVYIIVDALDEYPEDWRWILLQHLITMGPTVNVMITSRPNITPGASHPNLEAIEICAKEEDLRKYVDTQIQRSPRLLMHLQTQPELREETHTKISGTADGMFLLAKLHLESLTAKPTIKAVREGLRHLPKDLNDTYDIVMQRIDSQNEEDRKVAGSALTWVANAKRPLTVDELRTALAIELNTRQLDKDNLMNIELILAACAGLVIMDEQRSVVRLVHYTTQEYLDSIQPSRFPDAQTEITRTLLTFLAFDGYPDTSWYSAWNLPPLIEYSQYCLVHATGQPEVQLHNMILKFFGCAHQWKQTMRWRWSTHPWTVDWPPQPSALWIAAAANLLGTAKFLLEEAPINKHPDGSGITIASYYGHLEMVQLLIENGADVNTLTEQYGPPLTAASEAGHDRIARFLLKNGADANASSGQYGCALHAAVSQNHETIVRLLIKNGASVNRQGDFGTALTFASQCGMQSIVLLLLEQGADVNARGGKYSYALNTALAHKQEKIAQILIENGADVNALGHNLRYPLGLAADWGHENLVQLLINNGADPNAHGGMTLLHALWDGRENIVRLLLENGADANPQDTRYGCPLLAAFGRGDRAIVQLLVKHGAKVDWSGMYR